MQTKIEAAQIQSEGRAGGPLFPEMSRMARVLRNCRLFAPAALAAVFVAFTMLSSVQAAAATLTIVTKTLPAGYVNSAYSQTLTATGGSGTGYTWSVTSGTLPKGITLVAASGLLHGTPTAASSATLTFQVKDSAGHTASAKLPFTIDPSSGHHHQEPAHGLRLRSLRDLPGGHRRHVKRLCVVGSCGRASRRRHTFSGRRPLRQTPRRGLVCRDLPGEGLALACGGGPLHHHHQAGPRRQSHHGL